jgi:hypothetical protein
MADYEEIEIPVLDLNEVDALNAIFFADVEVFDEDMLRAALNAEIVVCLGNCNLAQLAGVLPQTKPAVCVLGANDREEAPPAPFRALHGTKVTYRDWVIGGLSGTLSDGGVSLSETEADSLLERLGNVDLFITCEPPALLPSALTQSEGVRAITEYLTRTPPIYHFYRSGLDDHRVDETEDTLVLGVSGVLIPEPLQYL